MSRYKGHCHCGAVGYQYHCDTPVIEWPVRSCQCSFCQSHASQTTSLPDALIDFTAANADALQRYRFGLKTADFLLCRQCGAYLGAMIETPAGRFGIVNTRVLQPVPARLQPAEPATYDGEDAAGRIARRERRWAPVRMVP